ITSREITTPVAAGQFISNWPRETAVWIAMLWFWSRNCCCVWQPRPPRTSAARSPSPAIRCDIVDPFRRWTARATRIGAPILPNPARRALVNLRRLVETPGRSTEDGMAVVARSGPEALGFDAGPPVGEGNLRVDVLTGLPGLLRRLGVDPGGFLATLGLAPTLLEDPHNEIAFAAPRPLPA